MSHKESSNLASLFTHNQLLTAHNIRNRNNFIIEKKTPAAAAAAASTTSLKRMGGTDTPVPSS